MNIKDLLKEADLSQDALQASREAGGVYLSYAIDGKTVDVEISAMDFGKALLTLSVETQVRLIRAILGKISTPGDYVEITNDLKSGARVFHVRSEGESSIKLLITR